MKGVDIHPHGTAEQTTHGIREHACGQAGTSARILDDTAARQAAEHIQQVLQQQRLDHPGAHAHGDATLTFVAQCISRNADDRNLPAISADRPGEFITVHDRHVDIAQHHLDPTLFPHLQRLPAIAGDADPAAQRFKLLLQDSLIDQIVLGDQYVKTE
ncbi:hypothetical protein D3C79_713820 [compost metagenome]